MKTKIFYFSATGNSLYVARSIATEIGDAEIVSIPKVLDEPIDVDVPKIGLVFPVYALGLPKIVTDFLERLNLSKEQYIFAVATCGRTSAGTLIELQKILQERDMDLNAGFTVKEANHTPFDINNVLKMLGISDAGEEPLPFKERLPEIVEVIKNNQKHSPEIGSDEVNSIGKLVHGQASNRFKNAGQDFEIDEKCDLCQTCEKLCPRENIEIVDNKVFQLQNCEMCFACMQWCPKGAIQYKQGTDKKQSHHPEVNVDDMMLR